MARWGRMFGSKPLDPSLVSKLQSDLGFYHSWVDFALGNPLGKKLGDDDKQHPYGIARWKNHVQPEKADYKGENGTVCVLNEDKGNYEEFKNVLVARYAKAFATSKELVAKLLDDKAPDPTKRDAKAAFDRAHKDLDDMFDLFKDSTKDNDGNTPILLRVDNAAHHGTYTDHWFKFTMKYSDEAGKPKEVSIATPYAGCRQFEDLIRNSERNRMDDFYKQLSESAAALMPKGKDTAKA